MCGRYAMDKNVDDLARAFQATGGKADEFMTAWKASFSLAPTDPVPIVRESLDEGTVAREVEMARWDFRPNWRTEKRPLINARLETIATLPSFRQAFAEKRAIVPMTGYYEWTEEPDKSKQPHFISAGGEILAAAGLYALRKVDDEWEVSCVVITREARDASGRVHDRMPVFLTPDTHDDWLNPTSLSTEAKTGVLAMLDHASSAVAATLDTYAVSRKVNSVRSVDPSDPTLIVAVEQDS